MNFFQFLDRYPHARPRAFIYAVSGDPNAFREDLIKTIRDRHMPGDLDYHRVEVSSEAQAINALSQQPVGSHRLVEIGDFEDWGNRQYLAQWIATRRFSNVIPIFWSRKRSPRTDNDFAQTIIKKGWWVVVRRPTHEQMTAWIQKKFKTSDAVSQAIIDVTGTDLARIRSMIMKLSHMTDGKPPRLRDVEEASMGYVSTIFAVADHILQRRRHRAMVLVDASSSLGILTIMRRRVKEMIHVRSLDQRGESAQSISELANIPLFLIGGLIERSKSISFERAAAVLSVIAEAEIDITAKGFDSETVLRRVVLEI